MRIVPSFWIFGALPLCISSFSPGVGGVVTEEGLGHLGRKSNSSAYASSDLKNQNKQLTVKQQIVVQCCQGELIVFYNCCLFPRVGYSLDKLCLRYNTRLRSKPRGLISFMEALTSSFGTSNSEVSTPSILNTFIRV